MTCVEAESEIKALQKLNAANCEHVPELIHHFSKDLKGQGGGMEHYVLMTRVPGVSLNTTTLTQSEQSLAKDALLQAQRLTMIYNICLSNQQA